MRVDTMTTGDPAPAEDSLVAERVLAGVGALRQAVVDAWQSRAVLLTPEEQRRLKAEIEQTCELLTNLTASA